MKIFSRKRSLMLQTILILAGFLLVIAIVGVASKIGIDTLNKNNDELERIVVINNEKNKQMTIMSDSVRDRMLHTFDMIYTGDIFEVDEYNSAANQKLRNFLKAQTSLIELGLTAYQVEFLENQGKLLSVAHLLLRSISETAMAEEEFDFRVIQKARDANITALNSILRMQEYQADLTIKDMNRVQERTKSARKQIGWLALFALLASFLVIFFIIRQLICQGKVIERMIGELYVVNDLLEKRVEKRTSELMKSRTENMRMTAELDVSKKLQEIILPKQSELGQNPHLDIAAFMEPAEEVGGDYYDVLHTPTSTHFSIGDVTGHGLESGILMLMTQSAIRTLHSNSRASSAQILTIVNKLVYDNVQRMGSDKYLSLSLLDYEYSDGIGKLLLTGQHETLIIVRVDGKIEEIDTDGLGFPVGLVDDIQQYVHTESSFSLNAGDIVVLYTDGITEAFNAQNSMFGDERLKDVIHKYRNESAEQIKNSIIKEVKKFVGDQPLLDDLTLVVAKQVD